MIGDIFGFLTGAMKFVNKITDYFAKKDMENQIKNSYEKDKKIDALEETQKADELIEESKEKFQEAKETIKNVSEVNVDDADLTDEEVKKVLDDISDPEEKEQKEEQIELAKEIKEDANKKQAEVEKDSAFNAGDEFTFKG